MASIASQNKNALKFLKETVCQNADWLSDENANTRWAVTRGLISWTKHPLFRSKPQVAIELLANLKEDRSMDVRISVGNALFDISRAFSDLIREELRKWSLSSEKIRQAYRLASRKIAES